MTIQGGKLVAVIFFVLTIVVPIQAHAQTNENAITAIAWNRDGTKLAVGHLNGHIEIVSADGQERQILEGHTGRVTELTWHPNKDLLSSGSADGSVCIWDASSAATVRSYDALSTITGLLWSQDGDELWAISLDSTPNLFVWNGETGDLISLADVGSLFDPQWNADGTQMVSGSGGTVPVIVTTGNNIRSGYLRQSEFPMVTSEQLFTVAWSPDDSYVAGGTPDGHVRVWNIDTAHLILDAGGAENYDPTQWQLSLIVELAFTQDESQVQSVDGSGIFRTWDIASSELLLEAPLPVTGTPIYAAAFSPDGSQIAYGGEDGELSIEIVPSLGTASEPTNQNALSETFTQSASGNPVWLEIEVGVADSDTVQTILASHHLEYDTSTVSIDGAYTIHLSETGLALWQNMNPDDAIGAVNVHPETNRVAQMSFRIDICVSSIIEAFGTPNVELRDAAGDNPPTIVLHYPGKGIIIYTDQDTKRANLLFLRPTLDTQELNTSIDYQDWSAYAAQFAGECTDNVQASS
jgi:WD40 repeat protein